MALLRKMVYFRCRAFFFFRKAIYIRNKGHCVIHGVQWSFTSDGKNNTLLFLFIATETKTRSHGERVIYCGNFWRIPSLFLFVGVFQNCLIYNENVSFAFPWLNKQHTHTWRCHSCDLILVMSGSLNKYESTLWDRVSANLAPDKQSLCFAFRRLLNGFRSSVRYQPICSFFVVSGGGHKVHVLMTG